jgi:23S rRNA (uracil1939-C5)-methyltransferase
MSGKAPLAPGDLIEVVIEKAVYRGLGLAHHEGQVVFVPRGLPGERLGVRVVSVERGYARAATEERRTAASGSRPAPCPAFPACGGCAYQSLDYRAQLDLKTEMLRESLRRGGVPWDREIQATGSPEEGWRTRATFHVSLSGGEVALGFYEEGSRRVVDLPEGCPQVSRELQEVLNAAREVLSKRPVVARNVANLRLAESPDGSERVLILEGRLSAAEAAALAAALSSPRLSGIGAALGAEGRRRLVTLSGRLHVEARVAGVSLRSHAAAFFQGNRFLLEVLAAQVGALLPGGGSLLDLYGGCGLFGFTAGRSAESVSVVEGNDLSVADAEENARALDFKKLRVFRGDVAEVLSTLPDAGDERIIVDPPRAGLTRTVAEGIGARKPAAVVYVSCDPATLARDLRTLATYGLEADHVQMFDMFPDSFHIESVVRLVRS